MELSTVVFLSLLLCGMQDVHADVSLAKLTTRIRVVEYDLSKWKLSSIETEAKLMKKFKVWEESLKDELKSTFLPSLIETLVKQAITSILTDDDIGHPINAHVLGDVHSLEDKVQNITTKLEVITRDLRHVERERNTYRETVGKERSEFTKGIRAVQMEVNQTVVRATAYARLLRSELNQTIDGLLEANPTRAGLTQNLKTLNTSCVVTEKEIKSYWEGLQEMQRNVSTDIRSLYIQLNQTIGNLSDSNQTLAGLTRDLKTLNTSCVVTGKGLQEMQIKLPSDIQSLYIQLNRTISDLSDSNQTLTGLTQDLRTLNTSCCGIGKEIEKPSTTTYPGTTEASTDPSQKYTVSPVSLTTQDIQASKTDASEDLTPNQTVPPAPVTTQDSDHHATPSAAGGRDLYDASGDGDLERVKRILATGNVDINYRRWSSVTPVMVAAYNGHRDVVEFLVGRGADVSLVDSGGDNVLHFACWRGDVETVKLILDLNVVDVNARNNFGRTPADIARVHGHQRVLDLLVSRGAH